MTDASGVDGWVVPATTSDTGITPSVRGVVLLDKRPRVATDPGRTDPSVTAESFGDTDRTRTSRYDMPVLRARGGGDKDRETPSIDGEERLAPDSLRTRTGGIKDTTGWLKNDIRIELIQFRTGGKLNRGYKAQGDTAKILHANSL